jgi:putative hydrolase of HD superfamily
VSEPAADPARVLAALAPAPELAARVHFGVELDRLKLVLRRTRLSVEPATSGRRRENSAEHSWHLAVMALVLADTAAEPVDPVAVARMLLVHDIVEIDAGDTFVYDTAARQRQAERERRAADRLFGLLPEPYASELRHAWEEFEVGASPDARFARALDRLQPLLLNHASEGAAWREHGITAAQVREVNAAIADGSPALWELAQRVIDDAVERGWL